jgi:RND family efflux transporter MFP subunit
MQQMRAWKDGMRQAVMVLALVVIAAGLWFGFMKPPEVTGAGAAQPPPRSDSQGAAARQSRGGPVPVVTEPVVLDERGEESRSIGTLKAAQSVVLYPQVTGLVTEIAFSAGDAVAKDQVLLRLDSADQQVEVERTAIALADAEAARERAERLAKSGSATAVTVSDAKSAVEKARIDKVRAELELAKRVVKAPFAGTIGLTDLSVGDLVTSSTAVATLADTSSVIVSFEVPERFSSKVAAGVAIAATAAAVPGTVYEGVVVAVDNRIDETSRTLKLQARLPNDARVLRPGMAVTTRIAFPAAARPSVPSLAIQWDRTGSFVWKIDGDKAVRVPVTIVSRRGGDVTIVGPLAAGDRVVVEGIQRIREGSAVTRIDDTASPVAEAGEPRDG